MRQSMWLGVIVLLAGCASNDDPCEQQWDQIGKADGELGLLPQSADRHRLKCGERFNDMLWERGYKSGILWYCKPEHLYLAGRSGDPYRGVCADDEKALAIFNQGQASAGEQYDR